LEERKQFLQESVIDQAEVWRVWIGVKRNPKAEIEPVPVPSLPER